jgi:hypothetical protein
VANPVKFESASGRAAVLRGCGASASAVGHPRFKYAATLSGGHAAAYPYQPGAFGSGCCATDGVRGGHLRFKVAAALSDGRAAAHPYQNNIC